MPQLDAFGIVVDDMAASLAFYRLLGLAVPDAVDGEGHVDVEIGGGHRLMFDTVEVASTLGEWQPPSGGRRITLAFRCESPADVDEMHARLVAAGHRSRSDPFDAYWGQRYATVLDPDGNPVDLYAAR